MEVKSTQGNKRALSKKNLFGNGNLNISVGDSKKANQESQADNYYTSPGKIHVKIEKKDLKTAIKHPVQTPNLNKRNKVNTSLSRFSMPASTPAEVEIPSPTGSLPTNKSRMSTGLEKSNRSHRQAQTDNENKTPLTNNSTKNHKPVHNKEVRGYTQSPVKRISSAVVPNLKDNAVIIEEKAAKESDGMKDKDPITKSLNLRKADGSVLSVVH